MQGSLSALMMMMMCMGAACAGGIQGNGAAPGASSALAEAGSADAQLRQSEKYWSARAVPVETARARTLLAQAANNVKGDARVAPELAAQREAHVKEIAFWISGYDGAELHAGRFDCAAPALPVVSKTKEDIRKLNEQTEAWRLCHNAFVANLNAQAPLGKQIPRNTENLMSDAELGQAYQHLADIYGALGVQANTVSDAVTRDYANWIAATDSYVTVHATSVAILQPMRNKYMIDVIANQTGHTRVAAPAYTAKK